MKPYAIAGILVLSRRYFWWLRYGACEVYNVGTASHDKFDVLGFRGCVLGFSHWEQTSPSGPTELEHLAR